MHNRSDNCWFSAGSLVCLWLAAITVLLTLFSVDAYAQAIYGSLNGTVTDSGGAAVVNATVTVTNVGKGTKDVTQTNADGNYLVQHLIPDAYKIRVEATGFSTAESNEIQVAADTSPRVDVRLKVGSVQETVVVTDETPQLTTDRAEVATVLNTRSIQDLPNLGRNATNFVLLAPGTIASTFQNSIGENPQQSTAVSANGQSPFSAGSILDGADNKDSFIGEVIVNPPLDSIAELKFINQNYDAEFGAAVAGILVAQTKSGSNSFHGSAFDYRRSDATQARNPFTQFPGNNPVGPDVPPSVYNLFGGSFGGPIKKNKIFFFGDYQSQRSKTGNSFFQTVPTALARQTCIGGSTGNCDLSQYLQGNGTGQVYDPGTDAGTLTNPTGHGRAPFVGNLIPNSRLSPQGVALLQLLPAPNAGDANTITNNFIASGFGLFNTNQFDVRIDDQLSSTLHLFGRYGYLGASVSSPGGFGKAGGAGFGGGSIFAGSSSGRNQSLAVGADKTISPTLLTDFRFGFFRYRILQLKYDGEENLEDSLGIPGLNTGAFGTGGASAFYPDDISAFGAGNVAPNHCNCPLNMQEQEFDFVNNWTKIVSNHSVKVGADFRYIMQLRVPSDQNRAGMLTFVRGRTASADAVGSAGGLGVATMLLGDVTNFTRFVSSTADAAERQKRMFFYVQDSWRVTPKLTLNFGVRWEDYFPETVNGKGKGGFYDIETNTIRVAGYGKIGSNFNVKNTWSNFAPRLAIAYQLKPTTVVRAGYGRSYDPGFFGDIFSAAVTQAPPVLTPQSLSSTSSYGAAVNQDGTSIVTLATGPQAPPVFPIPSEGLITNPLGQLAPETRPLQMRVPYVDGWNATVQHQFSRNTSLQVGYVGNKGTHEIPGGTWGGVNLNQATLVGFPTVPYSQRTYYFRHFGIPGGPGYQAYFANIGNTHYNALQIILDKRYSRGLQFQASYNLSKGMANGNFGDYLLVDPSVNYGRYDFNRTHSFILYGNYDLPFGRSGSLRDSVPSFVNMILGGIAINGTLNWSSGLPYSPYYAECYGPDIDTGPCRPDKVGSFHASASGLDKTSHFVTYFTPGPALATNGATEGAWRRPDVAHFGNTPYNALNGPGFFNSDMSISKSFLLRENLKLQLQAQAQNVFNHVNLSNPNGCIDCSVSSGAGRIFDILAGSTMRQLEFSARVTF